MSDADLQAIATQGPSGATGRRANFSDIERAFPSAPAPQVPGRSFADVERAFPPAPDLSSVSDEALRKIAGSNGTAAPAAIAPPGTWRAAPLASSASAPAAQAPG